MAAGRHANVFPVPDFRSSKGLFTTLKSEHKIKGSGKHLFDASVYQTDSSTSTFHDMVRSLSRLVNTAKPTVFHEMIATLAAEGRLMRLYTQNVDGIDVSLPSLETNVPLNMKGPWPRSIQLHGGLEKMVCSKCNNLSNFEAALFDGPEPPPCPVCIETDKVRTDHAGKRSHGIGRLRPRIVLYNEHNPDEEAIGAVVGSDLRARPDAVIVVGTSMKIPGVRRIVREMCGVVRGRRDGLTVWVNHEPPPVGKEFEECWDLVVKGASDDVARQYSIDGKENVECTESEVERAKYRIGEVQVMIDLNAKEPGIPTPAASPRVGPTKMLKVALKSKASTSKKPQVQKQRSAKKCATKSASIKPSLTSKSKKKSFTTKISKPSNLKIDKSFRATKPNLQIVKEVKDENHDPDTIQTIEVPTTEFPISCSLQATLNEPSPLRTSHQRRSSDIVSPTGSIPKDMYRLLCESP